MKKITKITSYIIFGVISVNMLLAGVNNEIESSSTAFMMADMHLDESVAASKKVFETEADNWGISTMKFDSFYDFLDEYNADKSEIVVAVVDTGLNENASDVFAGRVLDGASFTYIDNRRKGPDDLSNYADDNGHGTAVCGVIAQATDENVKIMPIKCLDSEGAGSELAVYMGIMYAINNGANIINLSCCAQGSSALYDEVLALAYENNICVVTASGNEGQDVANVTPGSIPTAITVSAIDSNKEFSDFANYGEYIDFTAPGEDVSLTYYKGGSVVSSGTSFSAPLVSAAIASLLECNPKFTLDEIESLLEINAVDLGDEGWDKYYGYGYIDMQLLEDDMFKYVVEANGDANYDKVVDINDVLYVLKAAVGDIEMNDLQRAKVGVYGDSAVTSSHALAIMRMVVGVDSKYTVANH